MSEIEEEVYQESTRQPLRRNRLTTEQSETPSENQEDSAPEDLPIEGTIPRTPPPNNQETAATQITEPSPQGPSERRLNVVFPAPSQRTITSLASLQEIDIDTFKNKIIALSRQKVTIFYHKMALFISTVFFCILSVFIISITRSSKRKYSKNIEIWVVRIMMLLDSLSEVLIIRSLLHFQRRIYSNDSQREIQRRGSKGLVQIPIVDSFGKFLSYTLFWVCSWIGIPYVACIGPIGLASLICVILKIAQKNKNALNQENNDDEENDNSFILKIVGIVFRALLIFQLLLILLKIDSLDHGQSSEFENELWPYWIIFSLFLGFSMCLIMILISKLCCICFNKTDKDQLVSLLNGTYLVVGMLVLNTIIILKMNGIIVPSQLDVQEWKSFNTDVRKYSLIYIIYLILLILFAQFGKVRAIKFIAKIILDDLTVEQIQQMNLVSEATLREGSTFSQDQSGQENSESKGKLELKFKNLEIPDYLFMTTDSYFRKASKKERKLNLEMIKKSQKAVLSFKKGHPSKTRIRSKFERTEHLGNKFKNKKNFEISEIRKQENSKLILKNKINDEENFSRSKNNPSKETILDRLKTSVKKENPKIGGLDALEEKSKEDFSFSEEEKESSILGEVLEKKEKIRQKNSFLNQNPILATQNKAMFRSIQNFENLGLKNPERLEKSDKNVFSSENTFKAEGKPVVKFESPKKGKKSLVDMIGKIQEGSSLRMITKPDQKSGKKAKINLCMVCFDKKGDSVYMPCGHGGLCFECAISIWKKSDNCYLCRKPIMQILQIEVASGGKNGYYKVIASTEVYEGSKSFKIEESGYEIIQQFEFYPKQFKFKSQDLRVEEG